MPYVSDDDRQALVDTADRLRIDPRTLAAVISYESAFNPRSSSPSGKGYQVRGLIGFDPSNVRRYGAPAPTIAGQMPQVAQYLLDRGWKPGQHDPNDLGRLYSIINAGGLNAQGNPFWGRHDINGSIADHVRNIQARHYGVADRVLNAASGDPNDAFDAAMGMDATGEHWAPRTGTAEAGSLFRDAGLNVRGAPASPAAPTGGGAAPSRPGSLFEDAGFRLPTGKPAPAPPPAPMEKPPPDAAGYVQMPGIGGQRFVDAQGKPISAKTQSQEPNPLESASYRQSGAAARAGAEKIEKEIIDQFKSSAAYAGQQWQGVLSGQIGGEPANRAASLGRAGLGVLGMAGSLIGGPLKQMVEIPVAQYTGSPEAGERAAFVAGFAPGLGGASKITPTNRALNRLVDAIGPENVPEAISRLHQNPQLSIVDVSDPVRTMTQGIAADPAQPAAQRVVQDAVKQRAAEAPAQINTAYTQTMGPAPNVTAMVEGLKQRARDAGQQEIRPALANAKPVDVTPVVKAIDDAIMPGIHANTLDPANALPLSPTEQELLRIKRQIATPGQTLTDPERLHEIQSRTGDMAYQLQRSPDPKDRLMGSQIRNINEKLIDQIDQASGGAYRPARARFKDAKDIQQAWEEGFDVLKNRSGVHGLEDRPEALARWMSTATPEEVVAKRLGVRSDIDQKIRGVRNQVLAGTNITKIEYNREKLDMLFGHDEATRLARAMDDAADMARTNQKLVEGSKTAETLAGREALAVRQVGGGNPLNYIGPAALEMANYLGLGGEAPGLGVGAFTAGKLGHMGLQKVGQISDRARNAAFARAAVARGSERDNVLSALAAHPKVRRALSP